MVFKTAAPGGISAAITAGSFGAIHLEYGNVKYTDTGISLSGTIEISGHNTAFDTLSSAPAFILSGYSPAVRGIYFSANTDAGDPLIQVGYSRFVTIADIKGVNCGRGGIELTNTPSGGATENSWGTVRDCTFTEVSGTAMRLGTAVSKWTFENVEGFGLCDQDAQGKKKPVSGSIGWRINPANRDSPIGGHQFVNCRAESIEKGWWLSDTQLLMLSNCFGDSCSDYALRIDGASNDIDIDQFLAGTSMGVYVGGSSQRIYLRGLTTVFTGVVPPWGKSNFFNSTGPYYDVTVADTASLTIDGDSWRGTKKVNVATSANLVVTGGQREDFNTQTTVPASTTTYLVPGDGTSSSWTSAFFRAQFDGYLFYLAADANTAPTSGSYVYTVQVNGVDTALTCTISGTSTYSTRSFDGGIAVSRGDSISIKLVTGNGVAKHNVFLQILQQ